MFCEPLTHLLIRPSPLKRMGVAVVVLGPGSQRMGLELLLALPGCPFQVIVLERMDEDFGLVQPRGVGGRIPRLPPTATVGKITSRAGGETVPTQGDSAPRRCAPGRPTPSGHYAPPGTPAC